MEARALRESVAEVVGRALAEDGAWADSTSLAVVPEATRARAVLRAKQRGVLSGCEYATAAFCLCDPATKLK